MLHAVRVNTRRIRGSGHAQGTERETELTLKSRKHNPEMRLKKMGCKKVDWVYLAQVRIQWPTLMSTANSSRLL